MPYTGNFPHEMVDPLTPAAGDGRDAHEFHVAGFGEKTGPEQMVFAGYDTDFCGPMAGFFFDKIQGEF